MPPLVPPAKVPYQSILKNPLLPPAKVAFLNPPTPGVQGSGRVDLFWHGDGKHIFFSEGLSMLLVLASNLV